MVYDAVHRLEGRHRWCLTGTPIQNYVEDLGALIGFLRVDPFDNVSKFRTTFVDPINSRDAEGYENLRRLIQATSLRRTKDMVADKLDLPLRTERTHLVDLNEKDRKLYEKVKKSSVLMIQPDGSVKSALQIILRLRQISNHGRDLLPVELLRRIDQGMSGQSLLMNTSTCESCEEVTMIPDMMEEWTCMHQICGECAIAGNNDDDVSTNQCPLCSADDLHHNSPIHSNRKKADESVRSPFEPSSKVMALLENLSTDREEARKLRKETPKRFEVLK